MDWKDAIPLFVAVLALAGVLANPWIAFLVNRRIENHKASLARQQAEYATQFKLLHDKTAEVIIAVFTNVQRTYRRMRTFISELEWSTAQSKADQYTDVSESFNTTKKHLADSRLFLSRESYSLVNDFLEKVKQVIQSYRLQARNQRMLDIPEKDQFEYYLKIDEDAKELEPAFEVLHEKLRKLLGMED